MSIRLLKPSIYILLFLLLPVLSSGQILYEEGATGDLPGSCCGPVLNVTTSGIYTVSGTLATPEDGEDWFQINVPLGYQLSDVSFSLNGGGLVGGVNFDEYGGVTGTGSGSINIAPTPYPLPAGTYNTQVFANFSTGTGWTLTFTISNPLVLDLKSFTAYNAGPVNRIEWSTGAEQPSDRFELERSSDAIHFSKIADMASRGEGSAYVYTDALPGPGTNYYRLKTVAPSGEVSYSTVAFAVVRSGSNLVQAFPNPVRDILTLRINKPDDMPASIMLTDLRGTMLHSRSINEPMFTIDMSALTNGIYLLRYIGKNGDQTIRLAR